MMTSHEDITEWDPLRENKAGDKVVEFLSTHVFGPERVRR